MAHSIMVTGWFQSHLNVECSAKALDEMGFHDLHWFINSHSRISSNSFQLGESAFTCFCNSILWAVMHQQGMLYISNQMRFSCLFLKFYFTQTKQFTKALENKVYIFMPPCNFVTFNQRLEIAWSISSLVHRRIWKYTTLRLGMWKCMRMHTVYYA